MPDMVFHGHMWQNHSLTLAKTHFAIRVSAAEEHRRFFMRELTGLTVENVRRDFPSLQREWNGQELRYFDGPGGTQVPDQVISAVSGYYQTSNSNIHGMFITSRETDEILEGARLAMSDFLNAPGPETISLGANMTTLNYSLSHALARKFKKGDEILITALDHEANRGPWLSIQDSGMVVREVPVTGSGVLDYEALERMINSRTRLVAVGWASNALGTVNDIGLIRRLSREAGAWLLVDAVHYAPHFPIDVQKEDIDFLLCSAYKFYGPHVGILYSRPGLLDELEPDRLKTQDQSSPYRIETGTLNHAAIAGVEAAVNYLAEFGRGDGRKDRLADAMSRIGSYEHSVGSHLYRGLAACPKVSLFGPPMPDNPGARTPTMAFRLEGFSPEEVCRNLGEEGYLLWDGDFYAARIIELLGLSGRGGVVRAGVSLYTRKEEAAGLLDCLDRMNR